MKNSKIIIFILFFLFILILICANKKRIIESFDVNDGSYTPMKHPILTNCLTNYGTTDSKIKCNTSAWVTNPRLLCAICDNLNGNDVNYFTKNNITYYGCNQNTPNSVDNPQVTWEPPEKSSLNKLNGYFKDRLTCNYFNTDKTSDLYLIITCDDLFNISLNGSDIIVTKNVWGRAAWNKVFVYYVPNVKFGDTFNLNGVNGCYLGGISFSYIWNKQLYILENNNFEGYANIITHYIDKPLGWSNIWVPYIPMLPPWMNNYIVIETTPYCRTEEHLLKSINVSFDIGDSINDGKLKSGITFFISSDATNMQLLYNNNQIYSKITSYDTLDTFTLDNINDGDTFYVNFNRIGGGNVMIVMLWGGLIYSFAGGLYAGDNGMTNFKYNTINTFILQDSNGKPFNGYVSYINDLPESLRKIIIVNKWATVSDNFTIKMKLPDAKIDPISFFQRPAGEDVDQSSGVNPNSNTGIGYNDVMNVISDLTNLAKPREYVKLSESYDFSSNAPTLNMYKSPKTDLGSIIKDCQKKCDNTPKCAGFTYDTTDPKNNICKLSQLAPQTSLIKSIQDFFKYIQELGVNKPNSNLYIAKNSYTSKPGINYETPDNIMYRWIAPIEIGCGTYCDLIPECKGTSEDKSKQDKIEDTTYQLCTYLNSTSGDGVADSNINSYLK